jgi:hypothetical protein
MFVGLSNSKGFKMDLEFFLLWVSINCFLLPPPQLSGHIEQVVWGKRHGKSNIITLGICGHAHYVHFANQFRWKVQTIQGPCTHAILSYEQYSLHGEICATVSSCNLNTTFKTLLFYGLFLWESREGNLRNTFKIQWIGLNPKP